MEDDFYNDGEIDGGDASFDGVQTYGSLTETVRGGKKNKSSDVKKIFYHLVNKSGEDVKKKNGQPYKFSGGKEGAPNPSSAAKKAAKVYINPLIESGKKKGEVEVHLRRASYGKKHDVIYKYKVSYEIVTASPWMKKMTKKTTSVKKRAIAIK